jgi:L-threonylcarbamoyladenylate synthase
MPSANTPEIEPANSRSISRGASILRRGGLVAFATETVYGLGADAANDSAVAGIFAAKQRPRFNPLIVHVRDLAHAQTLAEFSQEALALAQAFWPGPLTLVLPRRADAPVSLLATAGLETIALRAPAHETARALLKKSGLAIAAPSANRSGTLSSTRATHVAENLGRDIDLILDSGPAQHGIESTIIGLHGGARVSLRPGALPRQEIEAIIGPVGEQGSGVISSPGQLRSHYAPQTPLRLNSRDAGVDEALLAFGPAPIHNARTTCNLSDSGDLREAAANLFSMLRDLDAAGCAAIAVMPIPDQGLGEAINDRLRRAAAPRGD